MYFLASECRFKSYKRNTNYIQLFGGVYPESIRSVRDPISCLDRLLHGADKEDLLRQYVTRFSSKLDSWKITPQRWKLKISITYQEIWGRSRITLCRQKQGPRVCKQILNSLAKWPALKVGLIAKLCSPNSCLRTLRHYGEASWSLVSQAGKVWPFAKPFLTPPPPALGPIHFITLIGGWDQV